MSEVTLICRACQAVLTKSLVPVETADAVSDGFCAPDGRAQWSVANKGFVLHLTDAVRQVINREQGWALNTDDVWVNPDDLAEDVTLVDGYSTQCCGPDGFEGPNRQCACGALVGTEQSECFQEGIFRPDEEATYWLKTDSLDKVGWA